MTDRAACLEAHALNGFVARSPSFILDTRQHQRVSVTISDLA
jgi:hypothetical protein